MGRVCGGRGLSPEGGREGEGALGSHLQREMKPTKRIEAVGGGRRGGGRERGALSFTHANFPDAFEEKAATLKIRQRTNAAKEAHAKR